MYNTELEILEEQVRQKWIEALVSSGRIKPVESFEAYNSTIQKARQAAPHKLFTNSYMMRAEVDRLIRLGMLYQIDLSHGTGFVENQRSHWRLHLHMDLKKKLDIPKLDKPILVEFVYNEGRETEQIKKFREILCKNDSLHFYETYRGIQLREPPSKEQCDVYYSTIRKSMEKEGVRICVPNDEQLYEFERIYRERIDLFTQSFYTMEERRQQRDKGQISVVVDQNDQVLAISLAFAIAGGAVAVRPDCVSNLYATAFFIHALKARYDRGERIQPQPSLSRSEGWIATRNVASIRIHKMFGIQWNGRAFDQFFIPGCAL